MPYVEITTSASVDPATRDDLLSRATALVAQHLGKPAALVMACVRGGQAMTMAGVAEPCALVSVQLIGEPDTAARASLCRALTQLLGDALGVLPARVFVTLTSVPRENWAVRGSPLA